MNSTLEQRLTNAQARLSRLQAQCDAIEASLKSRHWTETDTARNSGIRRKPNPKDDARRFARYGREADLYTQRDNAERDVKWIERQIAARDAKASMAEVTREEVLGALVVRDRYGWHKVARVNKTTVSVETGYSWTDKIAFADIHEVRK